MGLKFGFSIVGAKQVNAALNELPKSMAKSALRAAARKALRPVLKAAKAGVHVDQGDLRDNLIIGTKLVASQEKRRQRIGGVQVYVGATYPEAAHGHLEEFGTSHSDPHPFLRPAWDQNKKLVLDLYKKELIKVIGKRAAALAKKADLGKLSRSQIRHLAGRYQRKP